MGGGRAGKIRVLFVCLGNICRSPAAEGNFFHLVKSRGLTEKFQIDSAGTSAYHVGDGANGNARKAAARHGVKLTSISRQFVSQDFEDFDCILAMDRQNYRDILSLARDETDREKVIMFRKFDPEHTSSGAIPDVPDPYYGGMDGFDNVQDMMMRTSEVLLDWLLEETKA